MKSFIFLLSVSLLGCMGHRGVVVPEKATTNLVTVEHQDTFYKYERTAEGAVAALYLYEETQPNIELLYYYPLHLKTDGKIERVESQ